MLSKFCCIESISMCEKYDVNLRHAYGDYPIAMVFMLNNILIMRKTSIN